MNLLFDFLKNIPQNEKDKLERLELKGRSAQVWKLISQQTKQLEFNRDKIEAVLDISAAHFDKITSQLLSKCYYYLFANDNQKLLQFLSERGGLVKHFYQELKRQTTFAKANYNKTKLSEFYKHAVNCIHFNMPIIHKDEVVLRSLANNYLALEKNRHAKMLIECKLIYVHIDKLFAAALIRNEAKEVLKQIESLGTLDETANEELTFAYWWLYIYYYNAIENFKQATLVAKQALNALKKYNGELNNYNVLRIELKLAELNYYASNFNESFKGFEKWMGTKQAAQIPDNAFYATKHLQVCLITGNLAEAKKILQEHNMMPAIRPKETLLPRDIISLAKYYLFSGQYDLAFDFIQLGFEKNPKGKYFQYEVELRNMQTAYFFLNRQKKLALQMCNKHIKYLRSHNYGVRTSDFPFFYILTKAIYDKTVNGKNLTAREEDMLQRYQLGSYAVYGRLLLKMLET